MIDLSAFPFLPEPTIPPVVWDCFLFAWELDMLELRLNELDSAVDLFLLVEAKHTFARHPKSLYFVENQARFARFANKIYHLIIDDLPVPDPQTSGTGTRMATEHWMRNQITRVLQYHAQPHDVVLISDVDEIPRAPKIPRSLPHGQIVAFEQPMDYYRLGNRCVSEPWYGTRAATAATVCVLGAQTVRYMGKFYQVQALQNAGWHFSNFFDAEQLQAKLHGGGHGEYDREDITNAENVARALESGEDVYRRPGYRIVQLPIGNDYPQTVLRDRKRWKMWLPEA